MELQTTNGHAKNSAKSLSGKVVRKAKKRVSGIADQARAEALGLVREGENRVTEVVREATSFVSRRPKTAIAIALGAGVAIGALANGRFGRAAFVGLVGLIADRFA